MIKHTKLFHQSHEGFNLCQIFELIRTLFQNLIFLLSYETNYSSYIHTYPSFKVTNTFLSLRIKINIKSKSQSSNIKLKKNYYPFEYSSTAKHRTLRTFTQFIPIKIIIPNLRNLITKSTQSIIFRSVFSSPNIQ